MWVLVFLGCWAALPFGLPDPMRRSGLAAFFVIFSKRAFYGRDFSEAGRAELY